MSMTKASGSVRRTWGPAAILVMVTALSLAAVAAPAEAQNPRRGAPQDRAEMERRFRAQMARMVKERLELSDEQMEALTGVTQRFEDRRRSLRRDEAATRRRVEAFLIDGGDDDAEAGELLDRLAEIGEQERALFAEEQEALLGILPASKVLRLQALREEMGRRIRALRNGDGDGRRRRPGGGGADVAPGNVDGLFGVPLSR